MSVRFSAFYSLLVAICSLNLLVAGGLLPHYRSYPDASSGDSVIVEKQHLIELPVQYDYVPLNNGQINLHTRVDGGNYNTYYHAVEGYSATNLQQQSPFSGYQYQVPQTQLSLPGLIRPSIFTTTPSIPAVPEIQAAVVPGGPAEIDANVIKSLVG